MRLILIFFFFIALVSCRQEGERIPTALPVDSILQSLTLEEKVGQMVQLNIELFVIRQEGRLLRPIQLDTQKLVEAIHIKGVGSIMNTAGEALTLEEWRMITETIAFLSSETGGGKVPVIYAIDAVHGANYVAGSTLFPHQLGLAATWNDSLIGATGTITAVESRAAGIPWVFSPILDVARQPLWIQFFQTFGEDPYLSRRLGAALTRGYQDGPAPVAACAKHFVGYGFPFSGKDRTPVHIGERTLREIHLPPFESAIKAGLKSIMVGSNEVDGRPMLANRYWVKEVLRKELGFDGVLLSDWADVAHLADWHRIAEDTLEATFLALEAGLDMAMVPNDYSFLEDVLQLVREGRTSEERIDASVRRILQLKWDLGLFEKEVSVPSSVGSEGHQQIAFDAAVESITLLKNDDVLPLDPEDRVMVCGPAADRMAYLNGAWSRTWQGNDALIEAEPYPTIYEAMHEIDPNVIYQTGGSIDSVGDLHLIQYEASDASKIVLVLGEAPATEKPGDRRDLTLSQAQIDLANALIETGKPVVLVLLQDRPQIIAEIADRCSAVIMAYRPGNQGGKALAQLLYGKLNFSGKLPFTYPSAVNDLMTYDHRHAETIGPDWGPTGFLPQYAFGHGLSYTSFEYTDLKIDKNSYSLDGMIELSVSVKNMGAREGMEVVQVYITDKIASITPSVKRLRDFRKVELNAGEVKAVRFTIPVERLAFVGLDNTWGVEPGEFTIQVGDLEAVFDVIEQ